MSISGGAASDLQFVCSVGMNNDFYIVFLHLRYVSGRPLLLGLHQEGWAFEPPSPALYSPCAGRSREALVAGLKCSASFSDLVETWLPSLQGDLLPSPSTCFSHCQCGCSAMLESSRVDMAILSTDFWVKSLWTRSPCRPFFSSRRWGRTAAGAVYNSNFGLETHWRGAVRLQAPAGAHSTCGACFLRYETVPCPYSDALLNWTVELEE